MRVNSGVSGFDELIQGGFIEERTYLLTGPPGSGKTTFAFRFLEAGAMRNEVGLYVTFVEPPLSLINNFSSYSNQVVNFIKQKKILFLDLTKIHQQPDGFDYELLTSKMEATIEPNGIKRVVIDTLSAAILMARLPEEEKEFALYSFLMSLNELGTTNLVITEMKEMNIYSLEHFVADGVILFHHFLQGGKMVRAIQLLKMRGTKIDTDLRKIGFGRTGLEVQATKVV